MPKQRTVWRCQQCGYGAPKWLGRCPDCGEFGTLIEEVEARIASASSRIPTVEPLGLADLAVSQEHRIPTGVPEFDRVLGGGLVGGSLVLLGGEPGIGKSTLLLQVADAVGRHGARVLYVCGEESPAQVKLRADRLGVKGEGVDLLADVDLGVVEAAVSHRKPDLLVVDSIQTVSDPTLEGAAGSVGQVRACTARFMRLAKDDGVTTLIVGHVTKEGAIAGPRVLEHMVDTVLYFEGDRDHAFRIVRAVKNRFGPVSEIGIFEMAEEGLLGVGSPSAALVSHRAKPVSGSAVMAAVEGSRPLLVEVQALVTPSYLQVPRRLATGVELSRVLQVLAVLERRGGLTFSGHDVYVSVAGGVRILEPAVDVPLALALASAREDRPVPSGIAAFGEIGLTGELRPVAHSASRVREALQLGFDRVLAPPLRQVPPPDGLVALGTVSDVLGVLG